jgi:hypothetical protein
MAATDYDFLLTKVELIEEAYRKIGSLADGESLTSEMEDTATKKLNLIIKAMGEDGVQLYSYILETVSLVANDGEYVVPTTNGLSIVDRCFVVDNNSDYRLERQDIHEYEDILNKANTGRPLYFSQSSDLLNIRLYPIPEKAYTLKVFGIKKLKDWTTSNDTGEFPARWLNTLKYALALELAEDDGTSLQYVQHLRNRAREEYTIARGKTLNVSDNRRMRGAY